MPEAKRFFSDEEFAQRQQRVREAMSAQGLDACLIASPENIYYLTGLDHMGYFAYQLLILPSSSQPILVTRGMERAVVHDQVPDVHHIGYADGIAPPLSEERTEARSAAVATTCDALAEAGLAQAQLGIEQNMNFLPYATVREIFTSLPEAHWYDTSDLVNRIRIVQTPAEIALTRETAIVTDTMMYSAIAAAGTGVNMREIMASIYDALFRRGGTYPGFVPLVRSTRTLTHEHGTWEDRELYAGDALFLEMSGCIRRYHAPMGRLVYIDHAPPQATAADALCQAAAEAAADTIAPGAMAGDVYAAWHQVVADAGLNYHRHHCGYSVGIGYPPSWSGSGVPVGLRPYSDLKLETGMVLHLMSWLLGSTIGDAFLSDTALVTETGCELLTRVPRGVTLR
jgi:Xaa-Pro dipeptidase